MIVYIYALLDPDTGIVRYIGKSVDLTRRMNQHCRVDPASKNQRAMWIASLAAVGKTPNMIVIENCTDENWQEAERRWIAHYLPTGNLTNTSPGGESGMYSDRRCDMPTTAVTKEVYEWVMKYARDHKCLPGDVVRAAVQVYADQIEIPSRFIKSNRTHRLPVTPMTPQMYQYVEVMAANVRARRSEVVRGAVEMFMAHSRN